MDESGDLGFDLSKQGTSRFFSMTFVVVEELDIFDKVIRKIFSKFHKKHIQKLGGVLHAHRLDSTQKDIVIDHILCKNFQICSIIVDKSQWYLSHDTHALYALITNKLLQYVSTLGYNDISFVASRCYTTKSINEKFSEYVLHTTQQRGQKISVIIDLPHRYKGLQIADFCSWSIFRKYEYGDQKYYEKIKEKIIGEYNFLM